MRAANRKALKPQPTRQAKLVAWHLTYRVPLHSAAIPEADIREACERFGMSFRDVATAGTRLFAEEGVCEPREDLRRATAYRND